MAHTGVVDDPMEMETISVRNPITQEIEWHTVPAARAISLSNIPGVTAGGMMYTELQRSYIQHTPQQIKEFESYLEAWRQHLSADNIATKQAETVTAVLPLYARKFPMLFRNMTQEQIIQFSEAKSVKEVIAALQPFRVMGLQPAKPTNRMFTLGYLKKMLRGIHYQGNSGVEEIFYMSNGEIVKQIPRMDHLDIQVHVEVERLHGTIDEINRDERVSIQGALLEQGGEDDRKVLVFKDFYFTTKSKQSTA